MSAPEYEEILELSKIEALERCPKCGDPFLSRRCVRQDDTGLYDLDEWCSIPKCGFSTTHKNVRVG